MPNRSTPYGLRYNGVFRDMVNNRVEFYHNGVLALSLSGNDVIVADVLTATGTPVLPQAVTIGGIAYTFPADNGDAGEQLQTDGAGVLTWEASGV